MLTVVGGQYFPNYSHASQFISELGALGAPNAPVVNFAGFLPAGVLISAFALLAWQILPRSRKSTLGMIGLLLYAMGYIAAAFFPCEAGCRPPQPSLSQVVHNILGLSGYVFAPLTLAILGWGAREWPNSHHLSIVGFVGSGFALAGLVLLSPDFQYVGIAQRVLEASVLAWVVVCSFYIRTSSARMA